MDEHKLSVVMRSTAYLRLLFPEQFKDFDFTKLPTYKAAEEMFTFNHGTYEFLKAAAYMKVLAAKEAKIGPNGIELVMPDPVIHSSLSPIPEPRRFDSRV